MHLQDGRVVSRKAHKRSYPKTENFDPLSDKWAEAFNKKRLRDSHPDVINTSRVVFIKPVNIWAKHPDKYDVYRLDCDSVPLYDKIPKHGWPFQIVKVKGKFYVANDNGIFRRYFPPKQTDKFARYINKLEFIEDKSSGELRPKQIDDYTRDELRDIAKEKGITNYSTLKKKQLANLIIKKYESDDEKLNYLRRLKLLTERKLDSAKTQRDKDYWNRELKKTKKELEELSETKTKKEKGRTERVRARQRARPKAKEFYFRVPDGAKSDYLKQLKGIMEKKVDSAKTQRDKAYWSKELEKTKKELKELSEPTELNTKLKAKERHLNQLHRNVTNSKSQKERAYWSKELEKTAKELKELEAPSSVRRKKEYDELDREMREMIEKNPLK